MPSIISQIYLFDEKYYMYFQLQQIKRYVIRDDFIEVVEEKVDEPIVSEAINSAEAP